MKKNLAVLLALAVGLCALAGCTKSIVNPQPDASLPHQGETASAEDGSVYAVGETVTAPNGDTQVAQPVTNASGDLVGVTLMTPEDVASQKAMEEAEASYTGPTNRQRITTTAVRGTSPNRLTTRPTLPETEPKSVKLPETAPSYYVPETTIAPEKIRVSYPGVLVSTENGVTVKYQIDRYDAATVNDNPAVTLGVRPLSALSEAAIVQISYNCYDADGNKRNEKPVSVPAALDPSGASTQAYIPLPAAAVRVEFFSCQEG